MKNIASLLIVFTLLISLKTTAQSSPLEFGLKAGANYAKFTSDRESEFGNTAEFKYKPGFYLGGFLDYGISEKIRFQPEVLLALQGTRLVTTIQDMGNFENSPSVSEFESTTNELALLLPLEFRYFLGEKFFIEAGPQFAYVLDRKDKIKDNPYAMEGDANEVPGYDYDKFDLGFSLGVGYRLSDDFAITGRYFRSLIERDETIKSSVFHLGLEYKL
ncbi:MAG TPA: porin family protein [Gillisia sp.]|nr:porin family protein [Gillisia sp.]